MSEKKSTATGISILDVLLIIFIVLKLCGLITWPWVMVLIPLWIQLGILAVFLLVLFIVWLISLWT